MIHICVSMPTRIASILLSSVSWPVLLVDEDWKWATSSGRNMLNAVLSTLPMSLFPSTSSLLVAESEGREDSNSETVSPSRALFCVVT